MQRDSTSVLNATTTLTLSRSQLRLIADSEEASPQSRISAVNSLLQLYGASDRNLRLARRVSKRFRKFVGNTEVGQRRVRWLAEQLAAGVERAVEREQLAAEIDHDSAEGDPVAEPIAIISTPKPVVGGIEQLPPDDCDPDFWDRAGTGWTRRELFFTAWGLAATSTRAEFLDNCRARPETVAAHTLELKTWARTRAQLDDKYAADVKVVRAALIQRGLEDTDAAGREELAEQVAAAGEPLVEFRKRDYDPEGTDLPALVRSKAGLLLDAIEFVRIWPALWCRHQPL